MVVDKIKIITFEKNEKINLEKSKSASKRDFSKSLNGIRNVNIKNALKELINSYKK